ncbi:MAG: 50S ribosomal protein L24 [Ilumatobacter sp.]|uniref:50S ribosomal protein L24 n=1 Tax=Ilumatobacter sp. TaxID=1967498 RepID=UPI0026311538|nr:50S ribosomal protein L24 [Ilumatobacter sp.]MDJ0771033.1 50S ribosomal protein L24 [Ilumatobacter sp.]
MKLRKGDPVRVITGKEKGKEGVVERVMPKENKVLVTGVNTAAKHQRAVRANEQAGIIDKDMPIDASNVMYVHKGETVRLGYAVNSKGEKVRIARPSGDEV